MPKKTSLTPNDISEFRDAVKGVTPLKQDKIQPPARPSKQKSIRQQDFQRQWQAEFFFSDEYQAQFNHTGPMRWAKDNNQLRDVKQLRAGAIGAELILDLHGINREQAKQEIAALLAHAYKQHIDCVCIVHGIGSHVLKQAIPHWLVQHPRVRGFHQAPLHFGGNGALLVLIDHPEQRQD